SKTTMEDSRTFENDPVERFLGTHFPGTDNGEVRQTLLMQTTRVLQRRRRLKRIGYVAALASCYLLGLATMQVGLVRSPTTTGTVMVLPGMMVLLVAGGAALGQAQNAAEKATPPDTANATPTKEGSPAKAEKPKSSELEQMLTEALVNNPDIRVAEAKLREAEAELNRVRLQVLQKVSTLHHAVEAQKTTIQAVESSLQSALTAQEQPKIGIVLAQEKAKMASLQAELPAVLGRAPQSTSADNRGTESGAA